MHLRNCRKEQKYHDIHAIKSDVMGTPLMGTRSGFSPSAYTAGLLAIALCATVEHPLVHLSLCPLSLVAASTRSHKPDCVSDVELKFRVANF